MADEVVLTWLKTIGADVKSIKGDVGALNGRLDRLETWRAEREAVQRDRSGRHKARLTTLTTVSAICGGSMGYIGHSIGAW